MNLALVSSEWLNQYCVRKREEKIPYFNEVTCFDQKWHKLFLNFFSERGMSWVRFNNLELRLFQSVRCFSMTERTEFWENLQVFCFEETF